MTAITRRIGSLSVSALGYGAMPLSYGRTDPPTREQAIETIHAALDAGITLIDTADMYAPSWDTMGHNEELVAEGLRTWSGDRRRVVVASKGGIVRGPGKDGEEESKGRDGSLGYLRGALERTLTNLGQDSVDLYY
jgi:aryl-alcohol dehydrogenase-like predicted oxidoreductase